MGIFGTFFLYRDVVLSSEVKMYWYNREGTSKCVLYREVSSTVSFIWSVLYLHIYCSPLSPPLTQIQGFPTIKSWPAGSKTSDGFEDYSGGRTTSDIVQWALERWSANLPPPEIIQV